MILKTEHVLAGIVISLLFGSGAGYVFGQSPIAGYKEEIERLETENAHTKDETQELQEEITNLGVEIEIVNELLIQSQDDKAKLQDKYDSLLQRMWSLRSYEVNVTSLAIDLMAKRANHSWEEGYYNPDIQGLIVIWDYTDWAYDIYEGLTEEFQKRGGSVITAYHFTSAHRLRETTEEFLTGKYGPQALEFIETYGFDHIAILYIGGPQVYFLSQSTIDTPTFDKLPLIAITPKIFGSELHFTYLENDPRW